MILNERLFENTSSNEDKELSIEDMFKYLKEYPQYNHQYTRPVKYNNLGLSHEQVDEFFEFLNDEYDGLDEFWNQNAYLAQNIYQEGRIGGHLVLDSDILEPMIFDDEQSVSDMVEHNLEDNYDPNNDDGTYDERQKQTAREEIEEEIKDSYITLKDFDDRVNELIDNLKATLDARIENKADNDDLDEDIKKTKSGKWVNVGKEGTHGEFTTKKAAREQQKAMFAQGFKGEALSINEGLSSKELDELMQISNKIGLKTLDDLKNFLDREARDNETVIDTLRRYSKDFDMIDESLYQTDSVSGNKMTFEVNDDGQFIVKDGEKVILNTKVVDVQDTRNQIKSMQDIEVLHEGYTLKQQEVLDAFYKDMDFGFDSNRVIINKVTDDTVEFTLDGISSVYRLNKELTEDLEREFTIFFNREGFEHGSYGVVRVKATNEDEAKSKFYADKKDDKVDIEFIRPTEDEDIEKGIRLIEDLNENPGDEEKIDPTAGLETVLNDLINDENEAINGYNSAIVNFEVEGRGDLTEVFRDIIKDEQNHIGNLQKVLNEINPDTLKNIQDGQEEAEETLQSDSNSETEETNE